MFRFTRASTGLVVALATGLGACSPAKQSISGGSSPPADLEGGLNEQQQEQLAALGEELQAAHKLTAAELQQKHKLEFQPLGYSPKDAEFLDKIQASALALDDGELALLEENGFVITERHAFPSFVKGYAEVYSEHLPVYISADAIADAVHRSYDDILKGVELASLIPKLEELLAGLHQQLASHEGEQGSVELDLYLAVARTLLTGTVAPTVAGASAAKVEEIVSAAEAADGLLSVQLFGVDREEDFSQFKPRGHYDDEGTLARYFRSMMWLGRIDFRLLEAQSNGSLVLRRNQVDATVLLGQLAEGAGAEAWSKMDLALQVFVGPSDYMTLREVPNFVTAIGGPEAYAGASDEEVTQALIAGGFGMQSISSHVMRNEGVVDTLPLSRSFALFGQRYVIDSHVFSQVVYDRTKDRRMMPSTLDVAFAALGNDAALPLLSSDLESYSQSYPGQLAGARALVDAHGSDYWSTSLYTNWLGALRGLSPVAAEVADPAAVGLPSIAGTAAWSRRVLNSQLGSWAQLRHDTLLYAKQSYSGVPSCDYPDGYVDPYPEFYRKMAEYAEQGVELASTLAADLGTPTTSMGTYFEDLRNSMTILEEIATAERSGAILSEAQLAFMNDAVRIDSEPYGCTTIDVPNGWLANLYFDRNQSIEFAPTIADVHTQPADAGGAIVGKVLHVASGYPRQMVVTVNTCEGPRAYVGAAFGYHEVITEDFQRLTDSEWSEKAADAASPDWLTSVVAD